MAVSLAFLAGGCASYRITVQGVDLQSLAESQMARAAGDRARAAVYHNDLGVILEREGDLEGALRQYRLAREKDPELTIAYVNAGNVWIKLNKPDKAIRAYQAALARDPFHPRALNNLAWVYLLGGEKPGRAVELLERAISADPEHSYRYLDSMGWALYLQNRAEHAIQVLSSALEETPSQEAYLLGEAHYHLGLIFQARGETDRAAFHLRESLDGNPTEARAREIRELLEQIER